MAQTAKKTPAVKTDAVETNTPDMTAKPDPFANLPIVTVDDVSLPDLSKETAVNQPFKYEGVHAKAVEAGSAVKQGWKYANARFTIGRSLKELKPTSSHGMIFQLVGTAGKAGLSATELVTRHRIGQIGNKRSKYCDSLPPVGWSEGWVDTAVTRGLIKVTMPTPAEPATKPE